MKLAIALLSGGLAALATASAATAQTPPAPAAAAAAAPATAAAPQDTPAAPEHRGRRDPNRVICRSEPILGSRINMQRQCFTAAEWETMRQQNRMSIDRAQTNKPTNGG